MDHKCINYLQIVKSDAAHFKLTLAYDPYPYKDERSRHQNLRQAALTSNGSICTQLPLAFTLMTVGQMQILTTERFGNLFVNTLIGKGGHQNMKIQFDSTYQQRIQQEDSLNIDSWFKQVFETYIIAFNKR